MRIWCIHPKYLDRKGLVALWREALLAQAVLRGRTRGYKKHPQLERFRNQPRPLEAINVYLWHIYREADARGFRFDSRKVRKPKSVRRIPVRSGQIDFEKRHLLAKLKKRDRDWLRAVKDKTFALHPIFRRVPGDVESWERGE